MKKGLLIVSAITLSSLTIPFVLKANAQVSEDNNSSLPPAVAPPRPHPYASPESSPDGALPSGGGSPVKQFGGSGDENNAERQEHRQKMMQRFDANHDGVLDDSERAQMKEFMEQRRKERESGGLNPNDKPNPQSGAGQGGNNSDNAQRQEFRQKMLQRFDANHDGQLDDGERAQMREFMQQRRMQQNNGSGEQP